METVISWILAVVAVITAVYGALKYIDHRISKKLEDPNYVKSISKLLRPYVIFNHRGEIIVDHGAMAFLHDIEIAMVKEDEHDLVKEITLKLKVHHATAPILLSLDESMSSVTERRGKKFDWIYTIDYTGYSYKPEDLAGRRFNVEIVT